MKALWLISPLLAAGTLAAAQDHIGAILYLTAETDAESLSEEVIESFEALERSPLQINTASARVLQSSGILTPFQVASLMEYRAEFGDVVSFTELSAIDGFTKETVQALRPYISLYSASGGPLVPAGAKRFSADASVLAGLTNIGVKLKAGNWAGVSWKRTWEGVNSLGAFIALNGKKPWKIIIGDFNARFGQGAVLWSGFSLSGAATPEAFGKRPTGLSATSSWSGTSLRGIAAQGEIGNLSISGFASSEWLKSFSKTLDISAGMNATYYFPRGTAGATLFATPTSLKASLDGRFCLRGVDIFGEAAYDFRAMAPAAVAGVSLRVGKDVTLSALARWYSAAYPAFGAGAVRSWTKTSDEAGVSLGAGWRKLSLTVDGAVRPSGDKTSRPAQLKITGKGEIPLGELFCLKVRLGERLRNYSVVNRTDIRVDGCLEAGRWLSVLRVETVLSSRAGVLTYLEGGFKDDKLTLWLRGTLFFADSWDDRIYSYERDVPGSFNVPAYYGRGYSVSAYGGGKFRIGRLRIKAYMRLSWTGYPFMAEKKPGKPGLKGCFAIDI